VFSCPLVSIVVSTFLEQDCFAPSATQNDSNHLNDSGTFIFSDRLSWALTAKANPQSSSWFWLSPPSCVNLSLRRQVVLDPFIGQWLSLSNMHIPEQDEVWLYVDSFLRSGNPNTFPRMPCSNPASSPTPCPRETSGSTAFLIQSIKLIEYVRKIHHWPAWRQVIHMSKPI